MEHVLLLQPVRHAAEVRAPGKNHEETAWLNHNPDTIRLQKLLVDSQLEAGWKPYVDDGVRLVESSEEKETQEHQEIHTQISPDAGPDEAAPLLIDIDRRGCWLLGFLLPGCCAGWRSARCHGCFCNVYLYCPLDACVPGIYGCVSLLHHDYCLSAPRIL